jgi:hypothetical protein
LAKERSLTIKTFQLYKIAAKLIKSARALAKHRARRLSFKKNMYRPLHTAYMVKSRVYRPFKKILRGPFRATTPLLM